MDAATKIFNDIISAGVEGLQEMIDEKQEEYQLLDFKEASNGKPPLASDDKRNLAKAIGGMANADGGIIVWGVKCSKNSFGLDFASELKPINQVTRFKTELDSCAPQLLQPYPDVQHSVIYSPAIDDSGFVVSCVPFWNGYPIRSTLKDKGSDFFIRTGSITQAMSYSAIADRFGRRPLPKLRLVGTLNSQFHNSDFRLSVVNEGAGLAKHIAVIIHAPSWPQNCHGWSYASGLATASQPFENSGLCFESPPNLVIHAGGSRLICTSGFADKDFFELWATGVNMPYEIFCDGSSTRGVLSARSVSSTSLELISGDLK